MVLCALAALPAHALAQSTYEPLQESVSATVVEIESTETRAIPGTGASTTVQQVNAKLRAGPNEGDIVTFENDLIQLAPGDAVFVNHIRTINGDEFYQLKDIDRQFPLLVLTLVFVAIVLGFAGMQGARTLLSLAVSIGAILFLLVPALLAGWNAIVTSLLVSVLVLAIVLFGTHGIRAIPLLAFAGTLAAVGVTSMVAWFSVNGMRLTGFAADASVYLNFATQGTLDFAGLLLGSIIIGMLGVLDDVAVTQASVVAELKRANVALGARALYTRAIRVGRDHVSSLVNTLALAYVGAALPLVLLFATSEAALGVTVSREIIAAEIARIIIGSIGIVLAVPFTTAVAAWWFQRRTPDHGTHSHTHVH